MKTMKRFVLGLVALVVVLVAAFAMKANVNAAALTTSDQLVVEGAQVRTTGNAGLKFVANVGTYDKATVKAYGVAIAFGKVAVSDDFKVGGTVNSQEVLSATDPAGLVDDKFSVVLYGIPETYYLQDVTARAYVVLNDDSIVYGAAVATRNLGEVTLLASNDGETGELITEVKTSLNTNYMMAGQDVFGNYVVGDLYEKNYKTLKSIFIADVNAKFGCGLTVNSAFEDYNSALKSKLASLGASSVDISDSNVYKFFNDEEMSAKWGWFLNYLDSFNSTHLSNQIKAVKGDGTQSGSECGYPLYQGYHLVESIYNFFNMGNQTDWPTKTFTTEASYGTITNNVIFADLSKYTIVKVGEELTLPAGVSIVNGYDYASWKLDETTYATGSKYVASAGAKFKMNFTPTNYTVSFDLQGGTCSSSTTPINYTIETASFPVPLATTMSKEGYLFVEWNSKADGTGDTITEIVKGSTGNKVVYAIWQTDEPIVLTLGEGDADAIAATHPTKYVNVLFKLGSYTIAGNTYKVGEGQLFSTWTDAIAAAENNDVIYLFAGTYTSADSINVAHTGVKIVGPNAGNHSNVASPTRYDEAVINDTRFNMSSATNGLTFDGVKFTGTSCIYGSGTSNGLTVTNCYINSKGRTLYSNNEVIMFGYGHTGFTLTYNYICNASGGFTRPFRAETTLTNTTISNNYFYASVNTYDLIRIKTLAGTFNFENNIVNAKATAWFVNNTTSCAGATITVKDNTITGADLSNYGGIQFAGASATTKIDIIGNKFNSLSDPVIKINASTNAATINIQYNSFATNANMCIIAASTNVTYRNNYSAVTYTNDASATYTVTNANDFASLAELQTAYAAYLSDKDK